MKQLLIRVFDDREKQIPVNSHLVGIDGLGDWDDYVQNWMNNHPNGKVDIIWN
jgi:uncharacterized short protein YbdD (DUF466 family)